MNKRVLRAIQERKESKSFKKGDLSEVNEVELEEAILEVKEEIEDDERVKSMSIDNEMRTRVIAKWKLTTRMTWHFMIANYIVQINYALIISPFDGRPVKSLIFTDQLPSKPGFT